MALKLNGSSSGYVAIDAPASAGSNTLVLPADNGSNGEYLQTNGSGTLDWAAGGLTGVTTGSGNVTITDGNLVVASGHGIDFSATGDGSGTDSSELLDDYEEGDFTPAYKTSNDDGGHSMGTQTGKYRKVGSIVHFTAKMTWSGGSGGSGFCFMEGLPYAPGGSTFWYTHIAVDGYACTTNRYLSEGEIHNSQDKIIIKEMNNSGGGSNYNAPYDGSVGGTLSLCGSYTTTS